MKNLGLTLICLLVGILPARTQSVPLMINYQGLMVNANKEPIPPQGGGEYFLSFSIYTTATPEEGGELLWGPQLFDGTNGIGHTNKVWVEQGRFNVVLGPVDAQNRPIPNAFSNANVFLEITLDGTTRIAPRQRILSAPYALKAADSEKLGGYGWSAIYNNGDPLSGRILGSKIADGTVTATTLGDGSVGSSKLVDGSVDATKLADRSVGSSKLAMPLAIAYTKPGPYPMGTSTGTVFTVTASDDTPGTFPVSHGSSVTHGIAITSVRGVSLSATNTGGGYAGIFSGNVAVTGTLFAPGKSFRIDHPLDPANKYLSHSCVESDEMKNVYDGVTQLDTNGESTITLPQWFTALNGEFRYQLTAVGRPGPNLHIAQEISGNLFRIAGGAEGMKVSWQVTGVRRDAWAQAHPFQVEKDKPEGEKGSLYASELHGWDQEKALENPIPSQQLPTMR